MSFSEEAKAQARANPNLTLVDTVGPYPVTYTENNASSVRDRTWEIYQVRGTATVAPLEYEPAVVTGTPGVVSDVQDDRANAMNPDKGAASIRDSLRDYLDRRLFIIFIFGIASGFPWVLWGPALTAWLNQRAIASSRTASASAASSSGTAKRVPSSPR